MNSEVFSTKKPPAAPDIFRVPSDKDILEIEYFYGRGKMIINMPGFFPCSRKRLKELLDVINLDWDHRDQHIEKIKSYLESELLRLNDLLEMKLFDKRFSIDPKEKTSLHKEIDRISKRIARVKKNKAFLEKAVKV